MSKIQCPMPVSVFWDTVYIPMIVDVQNLWVGRIKISKPFRKLGSSCHEIVEQRSRLELTEVTDSQERQ